MVGGSTRKDQGSFTISNNNGFSALESLRKKKKSDKVKKSSSSSKAPSKEPEPQIFWAPTPLNAKSWADVDDDDDDDFYATTAPPQAVWKVQESEQSKANLHTVEDSESEDDMLDLGDDDVEEEHDQEEEVVHPEPVVQKVPETPLPAKENERQLSKKERKKKELEELEALLADFGVAQKDGNSEGDAEDKKNGELKVEATDNGEKKDAAPSESKNAKKKKKKDKSSKETKETENQTSSSDVNGHPIHSNGTDQADEYAVDVKERLKKVAAAKKKKSGKELDGAAKAAAQEAAARNAKLAAAKKKEKNHHYNQQPVR